MRPRDRRDLLPHREFHVRVVRRNCFLGTSSTRRATFFPVGGSPCDSLSAEVAFIGRLGRQVNLRQLGRYVDRRLENLKSLWRRDLYLRRGRQGLRVVLRYRGRLLHLRRWWRLVLFDGRRRLLLHRD